MRLTQANSKLENVPRVPRVPQVTSANGKVRSPQSAARKQSKNKLFSIGCFPFLKGTIYLTSFPALFASQYHLECLSVRGQYRPIRAPNPENAVGSRVRPRRLGATSLRSCARLRLRGFPPKQSFFGAFLDNREIAFAVVHFALRRFPRWCARRGPLQPLRSSRTLLRLCFAKLLAMLVGEPDDATACAPYGARPVASGNLTTSSQVHLIAGASRAHPTRRLRRGRISWRCGDWEFGRSRKEHKGRKVCFEISPSWQMGRNIVKFHATRKE